MQSFTVSSRSVSRISEAETRTVLGNSLILNLDQFPELSWLNDYFAELHRLQQERDRISLEIQAIEQQGEAYHDQWIEPYTKTKNGKHYTYHQVRWLTGEYKKSGQPKVKTRHLSHQMVGEVRVAIARGHQIRDLEQERQQVDAQIARLQHLVQGTQKRLDRAISQNFLGGVGRDE